MELAGLDPNAPVDGYSISFDYAVYRESFDRRFILPTQFFGEDSSHHAKKVIPKLGTWLVR
jgi:hypothetical protein